MLWCQHQGNSLEWFVIVLVVECNFLHQSFNQGGRFIIDCNNIGLEELLTRSRSGHTSETTIYVTQEGSPQSTTLEYIAVDWIWNIHIAQGDRHVVHI